MAAALPVEIWRLIIEHLHYTDIFKAAAVCSTAHTAAELLELTFLESRYHMSIGDLSRGEKIPFKHERFRRLPRFTYCVFNQGRSGIIRIFSLDCCNVFLCMKPFSVKVSNSTYVAKIQCMYGNTSKETYHYDSTIYVQSFTGCLRTIEFSGGPIDIACEVLGALQKK